MERKEREREREREPGCCLCRIIFRMNFLRKNRRRDNIATLQKWGGCNFSWSEKNGREREREPGCCLCRIIFRTELFTQKQAPRQHCLITKVGRLQFFTGTESLTPALIPKVSVVQRRSMCLFSSSSTAYRRTAFTWRCGFDGLRRYRFDTQTSPSQKE